MSGIVRGVGRGYHRGSHFRTTIIVKISLSPSRERKARLTGVARISQ